MKRIKGILEKLNENKKIRQNTIPLFIGDPGIGKSRMIYEFAKEKNKNVVEMITSTMNPFEISGMSMPDRDLKKMTIYDFDKLNNLKDGDILFFDELLNGSPVTLNACLTLLETRKTISGKKLPDIIIIAAANPQGMTPLTPQIKERFVWYNIKFDGHLWKKYMVNEYDLTKGIANKLCTLVENEDFKTKTDNFFSGRSVDKIVNLVINEVEIPKNYSSFIVPILDTLITNTTEEKIKLTENTFLEPNEQISWLKLIKYKKGII